MIRVVLADDEELVRMGLRVLVDREDGMTVVGEASDGHQALEVVRRERPDVLLLDVQMPGMDGLQVLRAIAADETLGGSHVVVVTTFELDEYVFQAMRTGASGFVLKDAEPAELVQAIRVAASGEALLSPSVTKRVIDMFGRHLGHGAVPVAGLDELTDREREMVAWVVTGRSNEEIAGELQRSPDTVRTHVSRAMVKLRARDRAQLVVLAMQAGITGPPARGPAAGTTPARTPLPRRGRPRDPPRA